MPRILDPRILEGRKNRNSKIRKMFNDMASDHRTTEYILKCIVQEFGLGEATIIKIIKEKGLYATNQP